MLDRCRFTEWSLGLNHMLLLLLLQRIGLEILMGKLHIDVSCSQLSHFQSDKLLQMFTIEQRTIFILI